MWGLRSPGLFVCSLASLPVLASGFASGTRVGRTTCFDQLNRHSRKQHTRSRSGRLQAMDLSGFGEGLLQPMNAVGLSSIGLLGLRLNTYFTAQSTIARLLTFFCDKGTTVELAYSNGLRNIFYYENKMQKLVIPTGEGPSRINTIRDVCARLQASAKASYSVVALEEDFDDLNIADRSVDTVVSTYMLGKRKDPAKTFAKAMRLLKDGGNFVFLEAVKGEGPIAGVREQLGKINKALPVAFWSDPSLDIKEIVESWAVEAEAAEGMDYEVQVERPGGLFSLDPHLWGVIIKRQIEIPEGGEPKTTKKRSRPAGFARKV